MKFKRSKIIGAVLALLLIVPIGANAMGESKGTNISSRQISKDDITMGEVEEIFQKYLDENNINIKFGTQEYFDYIIRQELEPENKDEKLEKHPKYKLIDMYFAEYIVAVQNGDLNNPISISRFKNRTIGNIKNMNRVNGI